MLRLDSREIQPHDWFICLPNGEQFIPEAIRSGADVIIRCNREELAVLSADYFKNPSEKLTVVGVTGTNGKTSVTHYIAQALSSLGETVEVQGTITDRLTTLESFDTLSKMAAHRDNGGTAYVMEVSSHGIAQGRHLGIQFDVAVLTNISQDHLDYHHDMASYSQVKMAFLDHAKTSVRPEDIQSYSLPFKCQHAGFVLENIKAAAIVLDRLGYCAEDIKKGLSDVRQPAGRFERYDLNGIAIIVDYAHTPDGLLKVGQLCQSLAKSRNGNVITVFGCGGNRDRTKRPKMGKIASEFSSAIVLTNDNPRHEPPSDIVRDIMAGIPASFKAVTVELEREAAIRKAVSMAAPCDVVLVAGKGHESTQVIGTESILYSDRDTVAKIVAAMGAELA